MESDIEQITAIRGHCLAQLAALRENPKPTYTVDGQQVRWQEYAASLQSSIDWCDQKITGVAPFEVRSQGGTP